MRNVLPLLSSTALIALLNTRERWEGRGIFDIVVNLSLILAFFCLLVWLIVLVSKVVRVRPRRPVDVCVASAVVIALSLAAYRPGGFGVPEHLEGEDVLEASVEGSAHCMTYVWLKADSRYFYRNQCFGLQKATGRYMVRDGVIEFEGGLAASGGGARYVSARVDRLAGKYDVLLLFERQDDQNPTRLFLRRNRLPADQTSQPR